MSAMCVAGLWKKSDTAKKSSAPSACSMRFEFGHMAVLMPIASSECTRCGRPSRIASGSSMLCAAGQWAVHTGKVSSPMRGGRFCLQ